MPTRDENRERGPARDWPGPRCVHELIEEQAARTPGRTAVRFEGESVTYRELMERTARLAGHLRQMGVGPDVRVGVCAERSVEMVVGLLGVLRAGGAYVPLDPTYPPERLAYIAGDAAAPVVVTQERFASILPPHGARTVLLDDPEAFGGGGGPLPRVPPEALAYVIYTSGSTGRPKGAMNAHSAVRNRLLWMREDFGLGAEERVLQKTPFSFDVSVWELFAPLIVGACLVVARPGGHQEPAYLVDLIERERITLAHFVPSMLRVFLGAPGLDRLATLRRVLCSGEAVPADLERRFFERFGQDGPELYNLYGPTEAAVEVTWWRCGPGRSGPVPIGHPIANTTVRILGPDLEPVALGEPGELLLGGIQTGRGYHGRPALTAERFVPDPSAEEPGARLYRSGDLCRFREDGAVEYLGRIDHQVKIRGFRIEPGEIEAVLGGHPSVRAAAVLARERNGESRLVAYVVPSGGAVDVQALRGHLAASLPEYMVPAVFAALGDLPLTPSGKVDRAALKALPEPEERTRPEHVPPRTDLERALARLWEETLGVETVGWLDSFFDLGGTSISGALVINRLQAEMGEILHVVALFDAPTLGGLAAHLGREHRAAVARVWGEASLPEGTAEAARESGRRVDRERLAELRRLVQPLAPYPSDEPRNPRAVLVLAPPRSGTTLLRVMLGGHPGLFSPPELELLTFNTMAERRAAFSGRDSFWREGVLRAVVELRGCGPAEAEALVEACERGGWSTRRFYRWLQEQMGGRMLVDKSTNYPLDPAVLRRSGEVFEEPFYIHLVRHPYGMIHSFEEARIDQLFFRRAHAFGRRELAELVWTLSHRNILDFLDGVPPERRHRIRFEDLVRDPESELRRLCAALGIEYHPDMADPYADPHGERRSRMTDGLHEQGRMIGDMKFHEHRGVEAGTAERWREAYSEDFLGEPTWETAGIFGYTGRTQVGPLVPVPRRPGEPLPLSPAQERLWFLDRMLPGSPVYNACRELRLHGPLDPAALAWALREVVRRHEALRTVFRETDGGPGQTVLPPRPVPMPVIDLSGLPEEARRVILETARLPFDLVRGPVLRALLLRLGPEEHALRLDIHHIATDGWSMGVLGKELQRLYRQEALPEPPVQVADYAAWQRRWLEAEGPAQLAAWRERLAGLPPSLDLPADSIRPPVPSFRGGLERLPLPAELVDGLESVGRRGGATLFITLLAAFEVLLCRLTGRDDLAVGVPSANRGRPEIEGLIGFFVNNLVMRVDLSGDPSFTEALSRVRESALFAYGHPDLPFERLVAELAPERDLSRAPLFQVVFSVQDPPPILDFGGGVRGELADVHTATAKFDLWLQLDLGEDGWSARAEYASDLFEASTVRRWLGHLRVLLEGIAADPGARLSSLPLLTVAEREQVLVEWNRTEAEIPEEPVHVLVRRWAERTPDALALSWADGEMTYGELARSSEEMAARLRWEGVGPVIALRLERSPELVVSALAVLLAGGAYLPVDPAWPEERQRWIVEDSRLPGRGGGGEGLAYVIYTSGSTGTPKGTELCHRGLSNLIAWHRRAYELTPADCCTLLAGPGFDASVWETWAPLTAGASLHIPPPEIIPSAPALLAWMAQRRITVSFLPTPLAEAVLGEPLPEGLALRFLLTGGDRLRYRPAMGLPFELINHYGPTESTVVATAGLVSPAGKRAPDIGRPIANTRAYILDRALQPVPVGVPGELCVAGEGLARGYRNRPELTAERFVPAADGQRLYRTGDLARWLPSGDIEFLGRIDHQVKIRGFRIELGEVEAALGRLPAVREAAVLERDGRLAAYVVPRDGEVSGAALRGALAASLPDAMVPGLWAFLDALPLTPNGKVDRRALARIAPTEGHSQGEHLPPVTELETALAGVWSDLFRVERVGLLDDFFALGGHSLLAARLAFRVRELFGVDLPLRDVFEAGTLAGLAARIEVARSGPGTADLPLAAGAPRPAPASFAQQRLWFLDRLQPGSPAFNMPFVLRFERSLKVPALAAALNVVVRRHEALRTTLVLPAGAAEPVQIVRDASVALPVIDLRGLSAEAGRLAFEEARRPFDLEAGPLMRTTLLRLDGEHRLLLTLHHAVADGWSVEILLRELAAALRGGSLPALPVQYSDFAAWQRRWLAGGRLDEQLAFWRGRLAGRDGATELPLDHPRPAGPALRGARESLVLPEGFLDGVERAGRRRGATLFATLLSAFQALLVRYTRNDDLTVGTPVAGRPRPEVEGLIGLFVNLLAIRVDAGGDPSFAALLGRTREAMLAAWAHQDIPFERLVAEVEEERQLSRHPLFQLVLVLEDSAAGPIEMAETPTGTAKLDLNMAITRAALSARYASDLFDAVTLRRLLGCFRNVLAAIVADDAVRLSDLPLLDTAEREEVLLAGERTGEPTELVHVLFERWAALTPDAPAVAWDGGTLTYGELDRKSGELAEELRRTGVGPETVVALRLERSPELVVSALAVLKAGGAYLPIDPEQPEERQRWILQGASVVVGPHPRPLSRPHTRTAGRGEQRDVEALAPSLPLPIRQGRSGDGVRGRFDVIPLPSPGGPGVRPGEGPGVRAAGRERPDPAALAYVIYTSGSTGTPKGTELAHAGLANLAAHFRRRYVPRPSRMALVAGPGFDASVWETWMALTSGSCLHIPPRELLTSPAGLLAWMAEEKIEVAFAPTPLAEGMLVEEPPAGLALHWLVTGGDRLHRGPAPGWPAGLVNAYGPTEATVVTTEGVVQAGGDRPPSIGRPVDNLQVYVLDRWLQPVPTGVPGELCVAGVGLARGYRGRPDLTADRFLPVPDSMLAAAETIPAVAGRVLEDARMVPGTPGSLLGTAAKVPGKPGRVPAAAERISATPGTLSVVPETLPAAARTLPAEPWTLPAEPGSEGQRLYRTGDLARRLPSGEIEFLGRLDRQLKIRGFRIEPGEIEAVLGRHPAVREPAVLGRDGRLVAFVSLVREAGRDDLRAWLAERLPGYMVPASWVILESLPLTPSGKVDRRALAAIPIETEAWAAPRTPAEELVAGLFAQVLGLDRAVGAGEDFFDLGGHSLLATRLAMRLREIFGADLGVRAVFEHPTVAALAARTVAAGRDGEAPLVPVPREGGLPLSFAQQRLWFLETLRPGTPLYNLPQVWSLRGSLSVPMLSAALGGAVRRHEALRTIFTDESLQVVLPGADGPFPLTVVDLSGREEEAERLLRSEAARPFDLRTGPLFRALLVRLGEDDHRLLLSMHHIVADGWSLDVLARELSALYRGAPLAPLPIQVPDFAAWQRRSACGSGGLAWWRERLAGAPAALELPTDFPRPAVASLRGSVERMSFGDGLGDGLAAGLARVARRGNATVFMTVLAAFQALLQRYTGQDDLLVAAPVAGRDRKELEGLVGFFVNLVPLRADLGGAPAFDRFLAATREAALGAFAHQDVPFERLVEELAPERDLSRAPLAQAMLLLVDEPALPDFPGVEAGLVRVHPGTAKLDLTLTVESGGLGAQVEYASDLFEAATARRLLGHFRNLLAGIVADPEARLPDLPLLGAEERAQIAAWNGEMRRDHPQDALLHELFEDQARRTPDALAVAAAGGVRLTYAELELRSDRLARHLRGLGVGPEVPVGIFLRRSADLIVAMLAVLRSGGLYVPMDPAYPEERIAFLLEDSGCSVILTEDGLADRLPPSEARLLRLDSDGEGGGALSRAAGEGRGGGLPNNLAYLIYTSGSTGRPKAVAIEHRSAVVLACWAREAFTPEELSGVIASTSITFDLSVFEIFVTLAWGGTVFMVDNALAVPDFFATEPTPSTPPTLINTVPSAIAELLRMDGLPATVRTVNLAGEALTRALSDRVYERPETERLYNLYGPSEDTTYSTWALVERSGDRTPPIGRPVHDSQAFVLDPWLQPLPAGVPGELFLAGAGLARGYLGRPELTAERFLPDPFSGAPGGRMYRTGDRVRLRADGPGGELEYLGRLDHQVKIRGFRIELGEVEAVLARHPAVGQAAVLVNGAGLAAWVALREPVSREALRGWLAERLPEYMIPGQWVFLDALPLTPNGKVDRKALALPKEETGTVEAPRNPVEDMLAGLFAEVLGRPVGIREDFFQLGGHSLLAVRLASRVRAAFGVDPGVRGVFERPTVVGLAERLTDLSHAGRPAPPPLVRIERENGAPMSFAQERLWFLERFERGTSAYNLPLAFRIQGPLRVAALSAALGEVVRRHESLRTVFREGTQIVLPYEPPVLNVVDLPEMEADRTEAGLATLPFDLETGPLYRAALLRTGPEEHRLLLSLHHIVSDGWSVGVLVRELSAAYRGLPLPELPVQYADYAVWQRSWLSGETLESELAWWRERLAGIPAALGLPADRARPPVQSYRGGVRRTALPAGESLTALARQAGATFFMTALAAFAAFLVRITAEDDLVVGTPVANRDRAEVEGLIGFFVNTLVLRVSPAGDPSFAELLARVRSASLEAYAHQDLPFEKLVAELSPERDLSHHPLFQVSLSAQEAPPPEPDFGPGLAVRVAEVGTRTSKFDLSLHLGRNGDGLFAAAEYSSDLFDAVTVERFLGYLGTLLAGAVARPDARISELPLMTAEEQAQLRSAWSGGAAEPPSAWTLPEMVEEQARRTPDAVAVDADAGRLTFAELTARVDAVAQTLRGLGVGPETRVALCAGHTSELVTGLLGILKSGGACVLLDPDHVAERLAWVLEDSGAVVVATTSGLAPRLPAGLPCLLLDEDLADGPEPAPALPDQLAYVIYTSGSTGRPKGVAVAHREAAQHFATVIRAYGLGPGDRVLQLASPAFDVAVEEILPTLMVGATLVLRSGDLFRTDALAGRLADLGITVLNLTTAVWHHWVHDAASMAVSPAPLRLIVIGGEEALAEPARRWLRTPMREILLLNGYGPTEAVITSTLHAVEEATLGEGVSVPIGRPLPGRADRVLDPRGNPLPAGVPGELHLSGELARGYLGRPELTAERFVPDGFSELPGARLYRTGDLVRLKADGALEFLGRIDRQVKVRGFRVEPAEIEAPTLSGLAERIETAWRSGEAVLSSRPRGSEAPLSFAQERLWFLDRLEGGSAAYNIPMVFVLRGGLKPAALAAALDEIVRRHEVLRTVFVEAGGSLSGVPVQRIEPFVPRPLPLVDVLERPGEAGRIESALARIPFDLARGPLLRAVLLRLEPSEHRLFLCVHHAVADGWSVDVLIRELAAAYRAFLEGRFPELPRLPVQYADYAIWQRRRLSGEVLERELAWWRGRLAGAPMVLELPTDRPRPARRGFHGVHHRGLIPADLVARLGALGRAAGASLFMVLLAGFQALLSRLTGATDLLVGSPIANRQRVETEGLIGLFVNTLALRAGLSDSPSFAIHLGRTRDFLLGAFDHQDLPFERLVEELAPERDLARSPVIQALLVFAGQAAGPVGRPVEMAPGLVLEQRGMGTGTVKMDITLYLGETAAGAMDITWAAGADLFDAATLARFSGWFEALLAGAVAAPDAEVAALSLLGEAERRRLAAWSGGVREGEERTPPSILERFAHWAARIPDAPAVVGEGTAISWRELDARSAHLARRLARLGAGPETRVAVCLDRSPEMVVAILGAMRSGAAYVPLDPDQPAGRRRRILEDAGALALVTAGELAMDLDGVPRVRLESVRAEVGGDIVSRPEPSSLAYVLYTSGSTGEPKGVGVEHRQLASYVDAVLERLQVPPGSSFAVVTTFAADLGHTSVFGALASGGTLHVVARELSADPARLALRFEARPVDVLKIVPSHLAALLAAAPRPERVLPRKRLVVGGEASSWDLVRRVRELAPDCRIVNHYGPTETTVGVLTYGVVEPEGEKVPLGRPLRGTVVRLLDRGMRLVPPGLPGELWIGGAQVARGYLGRPDLTAERFLPDPEPDPDSAGGRLYRTGDRARWLASGVLEFLGRADDQVKIRGHRVEPGEVAAVLARHPGVREAAVLPVRRGGEVRLAAWAVPTADAPTRAELRSWLAERLPEPMVPSEIAVVPALPLTPNGKLDRWALGAMANIAAAEESEIPAGPASPAEELMATVVAELLDVRRVERVGREDDFFDLGGHSLLAIRLVARVREAFGADLDVRSVFERRTVAGLAARVEEVLRGGGIGAGAPPLEPWRGKTAPPLSFAQERLWFLDRLEPGAVTYNVVRGLRLQGPLDPAALARALGEIERRHEPLRTRFEMVDGAPVQIVEPFVSRPLPIAGLAGLPEPARRAEAARLVSAEGLRPFDLARGPMLRSVLLRLGADEHVLVLGVHHISFDAWSLDVLRRELGVLYAAFVTGQASPLPSLPVRYADFAAWQRRWLSGEVLESQLAYWREALAGRPPALELPTDRPRPAVQSLRGSFERTVFPRRLLDGLERLSRSRRTTVFMTLLAGFQALLSRLTGQDDLLVGTPVANRERPETQGLIGFFVNTLVMRARLPGDPAFPDLLARVREAALQAYAHQDLPFERLVSELAPGRDLSRTPLFQAVFSWQPSRPAAPELAPGLALGIADVATGTSKFDLSLFLGETRDGLAAVMEHAVDLFDRATVRRWLGHLQNLLQGIVEGEGTPLSALPLMDEAERAQLVREWNDTATGWPREATVHGLFEEQARRFPDRIALAGADGEVTYAELNRRAERLAARLRELGVGPDDRVGLCAERSADLIAALLGILKAGGAYLPLDPQYPAERLAGMMADAEVRVLVAQEGLEGSLPEVFRNFGGSAESPHPLTPSPAGRGGTPTPSVFRVLGGGAPSPGAWGAGRWERGSGGEDSARMPPAPRTAADPDNLAYVMFTSGSTGRPKGVAVTHRNVVRLVRETGYARFDADRVFLQAAPVPFDASTFEIWGPLLNGGRLAMLPQGPIDLGKLGEAIERHGVTTLWLTAGLFHQMVESHLDRLRPVSQLVAGGDVLSPAHVRRAAAGLPGTEILNGYGPTEGTTFTTVHPVRAGDSEGTVPIGRPIANARAYVLDLSLRPVPMGVAGHLHIGGDGLARGYLGRPDLTAERFVPDGVSGEPGARLYATGDLARWRSGGVLEFLGRADHQVKLRGFRIEPGEIESVLLSHPEVESAVVLAREDVTGDKGDKGDKRLVAYVVPSPESAPDPVELRALLELRLPAYMVPSAFVVLPELPLTANGKVDRRALPAPDFSGGSADFVPPATLLEQEIAEVWRQVLGVERVGLRDSFWDLGGHSLLATKVLARLHDALGLDLPLQALFEAPTLAGFAEAVGCHTLAASDDEDLADLLAELDDLSDLEARELLERESRDVRVTGKEGS